jgi:hypothetical protein
VAPEQTANATHIFRPDLFGSEAANNPEPPMNTTAAQTKAEIPSNIGAISGAELRYMAARPTAGGAT